MLSLFKRHTNTPQPELSKMLSEFNRSLMLIADKSLLINNFISKIRQICPVEIIHLFLLDENTESINRKTARYPLPSLSMEKIN